jgi:hypothetical protein
MADRGLGDSLMGEIGLKGVNVVKAAEQHQFGISNRFGALEH